jgi:hypothetical protein
VEFIRVWAHEVPVYEAQGWQLHCVRQGKPCEAVLGPGYADCLMVRTHAPIERSTADRSQPASLALDSARWESFAGQLARRLSGGEAACPERSRGVKRDG